jgi:hypothetical protein
LFSIRTEISNASLFYPEGTASRSDRSSFVSGDSVTTVLKETEKNKTKKRKRNKVIRKKRKIK